MSWEYPERVTFCSFKFAEEDFVAFLDEHRSLPYVQSSCTVCVLNYGGNYLITCDFTKDEETPLLVLAPPPEDGFVQPTNLKWSRS